MEKVASTGFFEGAGATGMAGGRPAPILAVAPSGLPGFFKALKKSLMVLCSDPFGGTTVGSSGKGPLLAPHDALAICTCTLDVGIDLDTRKSSTRSPKKKVTKTKWPPWAHCLIFSTYLTRP